MEGPPYPTNLPFFETEALAFFTDKSNFSFPYLTNAESLDFIKQLYASGATKVVAIVTGADTNHPIVREIEIYSNKAEAALGIRRTLDAIISEARNEGRLIQAGAGDDLESINVWWEDI